MTIQHENINDPYIHEPKGASTANSNQVYVANGSGSGVWENLAASKVTIADAGDYYAATTVEAALQELKANDPHGWVQYTDTFYTGGTTLSISATAPGTSIPCNKGTSIETNSPYDMPAGGLWNSSTNRFDPINENDFYILRVGFNIATLTGTVNYVELALDIGGGIGIIFQDTRVPRDAGQEMVFTIPVYTGSTFIANNGIIYLRKDGAGTFEIEDIQLSIARIHRGR